MTALLHTPVFVLFAVLALGLALGRISLKGVSLGSSGVLFVALAAGHFGLSVPNGVTELGTALFVYCVGLGAGNRFFASLRSRGAGLVLLSLVVVGTAWCITYAGCELFGISHAVGAGLFAGACTSTPGLAAATEALQQAGADTAAVNIGYGVVYPFGVVGVVLFVQVLPRLLRCPWESTRRADAAADPQQIITRVVRVSHPNLLGTPIVATVHEGLLQCRVTRILREGRLVPLHAEDCWEEGARVLLVGTREQSERDTLLIGSPDEDTPVGNRFAGESAEVIVLEKSMSNRTLGELDTPAHDGVIVSRITRLGVTFVPSDDTEIIRNDVLRVVGLPQDIAAFKTKCRHRSTAIGTADILSLSVGVALGIALGKLTLGSGEGGGFSLGMAGGPLLVALILGHFGHIGPIAGYMPRNARILLMEFALMLFLAGAGVSGGSALVETLRQQGLTMFFIGVAVTSVPLLIGYLFARRVLHLSMEEALGGICGGMTSTPALGAITAKTDKQTPVIAYATAYPAALILMALLAKALV
ncbi:MAG: YidE/YbjL duplication [Akkermansia sp.]|nr:YidE/YbjL duplication [Akkermansia sp.]